MEITELLKFTLDNKGSDLHLSGDNQPIVRIDGELQRIKTDVLTSDQIRGMLFSIMTEEQRSVYERELEHDFAISLGQDARFRVNAFTNRAGAAAVLRVIPTKIPTMEQLDLPPVIRRLAELEKGLVPVENPRQVSAWRYPSQYGPRAPTFSRAALAYPKGQEALFVSGTASIVGHETLHAGDVAAQCRETVRNLECVVQEANRLARSRPPFALAGMTHRAYVRHARDADAVQRTLQPLLGGAPLVCVQADICRSDLLVEVESQAIQALPSR